MAGSVEALYRARIRSAPPLATEIRAVDPDLVLVGNSMLGANVDKALFDAELSRRAGHPVRTFFCPVDGVHAPVFAVVTFDHLARAGLKGVPVGYVSQGVTSFLVTTARGRDPQRVKEYLVRGNDAFFRKYRDPSLKRRLALRPLSRAYYDSPEASRKVVHSAVDWVYKRFHHGESAFFLMKARFSGLVFDPEVAAPSPLPLRPENSFIPDEAAALPGSPLFLVSSHPNYLKTKSTRSSEEKREAALSEWRNIARDLRPYGCAVLDMDAHRELDDPALFLDNVHFTAEGRALNSRLLADDIFENGLYRTR